jgi:hypothetical protein
MSKYTETTLKIELETKNMSTDFTPVESENFSIG